MPYHHTQKSYPTILLTLALLAIFTWAHITASFEPPSPDSGTNLAVTTIMTLVVLIISSFCSLQVTIDKNSLRIKFGYGIFKKNSPSMI